MISAVCVYAIPSGEGKRIADQTNPNPNPNPTPNPNQVRHPRRGQDAVHPLRSAAAAGGHAMLRERQARQVLGAMGPQLLAYY